MGSGRVLVVDDQIAPARRLLSQALHPWQVCVAESGRAGLGMLASGGFAALVVDYRMPGIDGVEVCRRARAAGFGGIIVLWTAYLADAPLERVLRAGANAVLPKRDDFTCLREQLDQLARLADKGRTGLVTLPPAGPSVSHTLARTLSLSDVEARLLAAIELSRDDGEAAPLLVERVWGVSGSRHTFDVALRRLRDKLGGSGWDIPRPGTDGRYRLTWKPAGSVAS